MKFRIANLSERERATYPPVSRPEQSEARKPKLPKSPVLKYFNN
jgi:hypothetical protein